MTQLSKEIAAQIASTYKLMAEKARHRPGTPSAGRDNLERESLQYAEYWWEKEDKQKFRVGCCYNSTRPAMIFAIEAARLMCAGRSNKRALELLQLGVEQLKSVTATSTSPRKPSG